MRDWWAAYPFSCLEQQTSKAVGLRDGKLWQTVVANLPTYLDSDGLASYFPATQRRCQHGQRHPHGLPAGRHARGCRHQPRFALPDEARAPMERALIAFCGRPHPAQPLEPAQRPDMRKLAAIEALSRYGKAQGRMLSSITIAPNQWPTHSVIDWVNVLKRVADVPERDKRLAEAMQILRARLSFQGTKLIFSAPSRTTTGGG